MTWPIDLSYSLSASIFERILEFLDDEADNRAAAGSAMSDYEREPRALAEELRDWLTTPEPGPPVLSASAAASYNPTNQLGVTTGGERG